MDSIDRVEYGRMLATVASGAFTNTVWNEIR